MRKMGDSKKLISERVQFGERQKVFVGSLKQRWLIMNEVEMIKLLLYKVRKKIQNKEEPKSAKNPTSAQFLVKNKLI